MQYEHSLYYRKKVKQLVIPEKKNKLKNQECIN